MTEIRELTRQASFDADKAELLLHQLEVIEQPTALQLAYLASAEGIMCLHIKSPTKRLKNAKRSVELINQAVDMEQDNLEIRFMRFAIESQLPKILGLSKNIKTDQAFLSKHFNQANFAQIPYRSLEEMVHVLEESKHFSTKEIVTMRAQVYAHHK